jgi:DNA-binding NtrC family response regulator
MSSPSVWDEPAVDAKPAESVQIQTLAELERSHILMVLAICCGNKTHTAQKLGIDRRTLTRKLSRFGRE